MLFAITGVTGLLGRNFLLETIKNNKNNLSHIKFILFGRDHGSNSLKNRIITILEEELEEYIGDYQFNFNQIYNWIGENTKFINYNLESPKLGISDDDLIYLKAQKIDFFIHIAALTNLWNDEKSKRDVRKINLVGTQNIIQLAKSCNNIAEFVYVGTAYSCGKTYGDIKPDYVNLDQEFRSEYEKIKLQAEIEVRRFEKESSQKCRYFRPSVICGRMIEEKFGRISKFDVFYGFGYALLGAKKNKISNIKNLISEKCDLDIRYQISFEHGLNIVPVDYCAKIMYQVCVNDDQDRSFHLAHEKETSHKFYFQLILESLNISGARAVEYYPHNQNKSEKFFYKIAGNVLSPYVNSPRINFDVSNINNKYIKLPEVEEAKNFKKLLKYATNHKYGLNHD
ncbi:MAG: nucleoside-diphosphate-sugar epimerase [Ulvibacter sp.]|jgi:nucleoside-diphosphate-sugar epimerase